MATILSVRPQKLIEVFEPSENLQSRPVSHYRTLRRQDRSRTTTSKHPRSSALERIKRKPTLAEQLERGDRPNSGRPVYSEMLAIVQCEETDTYQIIVRNTEEILCEGGFETLEYCNAAMRELGQTFVLEPTYEIEAETLEAMQEIVYQHWYREQVELELAIV